MPTPEKGESKSAWMERCVPYVVKEGKEQDQAVAQCLNMWKERAVPRRLLTPVQFAQLSETERDAESAITTTQLGDPLAWGKAEDRTIRYIFSTPAVGRDMHTVAANAWQMRNFLKNPVFLWAHDDRQPPIGRVIDIADEQGTLRGAVQYATRELNPFADTVYELVRAGYINAVSTSWLPIEWDFSQSADRPYGIDFRKVELLEISQVPIPALPEALATARSRGIDTGPLFAWAERLLDEGGRVALPREELESLRRAAKMPATATSNTGANGNGNAEDKSAMKKQARALLRARNYRGLPDVASAVALLKQFGWLRAADLEAAAREGDGSKVPGVLFEALEAMTETFRAYSTTDANEFDVDHDDHDDLATDARKLVERCEHPLNRVIVRTALTRSKGLSNANKDMLEEAEGHHERAFKHSKALGEHHDAVTEHADGIADAHQRAKDSLAQAGVHLRAIQDPTEATDEDSHIDEAVNYVRECGEALHEATTEHRNLEDRHEDIGDSHRAMHRSLKAAHRAVRSVTQNGAETSEADEPDADELADVEKAHEQRAAAKAARERAERAERARKLRGPVTIEP